MAAIAESLRFLAIVFLAFDIGGLLGPSVTGIVRYAAAPQLLFAAGFSSYGSTPSSTSPSGHC